MELPVHDGRAVRIEDIPFGTWRVRARAPSIVATASEVDVTEARLDVRVDLKAKRAGTVWLILKDLRGRPVLLPAESLPPLSTSVGEIAGQDLAAKQRRTSVGYVGVPFGRADLRSTDIATERDIRFLPFDVAAPACIDVVAGAANELELHVEMRALVQLRAVEAYGRDDIDAAIDVFAEGRRVLPLAERWRSRWRAYLPAGTYRIDVTRRGKVTTELLHVNGEDITRKLRG